MDEPMTTSVPLDLDKLKQLRADAGLTMAEAAERARLSGRQAWYAIESGRNADVRVSTLERIAAALGTTARELLIDDEASQEKSNAR
ncbi:MAG: helix-turn-helix transcriptional regulator [Planctomycetota bacterium]